MATAQHKTLYIPDVIAKRDTRYLEDLQEHSERTEWEDIERWFKTYVDLAGEKLDEWRFTSFWILPNGKLYPISEGTHEHTAQLFMDEASGYVHSEDSLSKYAVRYSDWLKLRLPQKGLTLAQEETIGSLTSHRHYRLMMETIFPQK